MSDQIDYNDPRYAQAAAEILRRHDSGEPEANITSAVRDFLILTGLVRGDEIVEENPPAQGSRRAVDLAALDTFIEFKRRIGTAGGFNPNAEYVQQLDDYLVLQRRVILQDNSCAHFEAGNERVRVSHDERSVAGEEDPSVFSHNPSL